LQQQIESCCTIKIPLYTKYQSKLTQNNIARFKRS